MKEAKLHLAYGAFISKSYVLLITKVNQIDEKGQKYDKGLSKGQQKYDKMMTK